MYDEDELTPISGLQHVMFCERQFALIHIEGLWEENRFTAEGKVLHERVDSSGHESRKLFRQEFAMPMRSLEYGLIGKADLVEFYLKPDGGVAEATPVEFKRGHDKESDVDRVQLYAQSLCLREMTGAEALHGELYYLGAHRRTSVEYSGELRAETLHAIERARTILAEGKTPAASYERDKCERCSLVELCMPERVGDGGRRVAAFMEAEVAAIRKECS